MPWQQHVVDVALELDPETNELVYPEVGLTVPRQSGKSTLLLCKAVHRATAHTFFGTRQRLVYTAQTRHKAREKWEEDFVGDLEASPYYAARIKTHKGNGNEHIRFPSGSRFGIEANTEKAGHGSTLDEAYIDEAFAHQDKRLEQAFRPAMITRRNKQLWWVSTAGWKGGSPYLEEKVKSGRLAVKMDRRTGLCYFEWSSPGDDEEGIEPEDPKDPETWWRCMPALGHTMTVEAIAAELVDFGLIEFMRAYLNRWVSKDAVPEWSIVTETDWLDRKIEPQRPVGPVMFAIASAYPDAQETAIVVVGQTAGGRISAQVLAHRPGASWAVDELKRLTGSWSNLGVAIDRGGPAGRLIAPLTDANVPLVEVGMQDAARAFGLIQTEIGGDLPRFAHFGQPELTKAVASATKRPLGDGFTWARKDSTDLSPIEATTIGVERFLALARLNAPVDSVYETRGLIEV